MGLFHGDFLHVFVLTNNVDAGGVLVGFGDFLLGLPTFVYIKFSYMNQAVCSSIGLLAYFEGFFLSVNPKSYFRI